MEIRLSPASYIHLLSLKHKCSVQFVRRDDAAKTERA